MNKRKRTYPKTIEIKCVICGKKRMVCRTWAKYCSNTCKTIGWADSKKKEKYFPNRDFHEDIRCAESKLANHSTELLLKAEQRKSTNNIPLSKKEAK